MSWTNKGGSGGGDDGPVTRPRAGRVIGVRPPQPQTQVQPQPTPPTTPPPSRPVVPPPMGPSGSTGAPSGTSDSGGDEVEAWGLELQTSLGLSGDTSGGGGAPVVGPTDTAPFRPRRNRERRVAVGHELAVDLIQSDPQMLATMKPQVVARTYKDQDDNGKSQMFGHLTAAPAVLAKVMEEFDDVAPDLTTRLLATGDNQLISAVLGEMGGASTGSATVIKSIVAKAGQDRRGLLALTMQSAGDTVDEADSAGTAGRHNDGRLKLVSQVGASGPSKESVDTLTGSAANALVKARPPKGADLNADRLKDKDESERGRIIQQTVRAIGEVLKQVVGDLKTAAITPELSMVTATIYNKANAKFGAAEAAKQAGGHIFLRVVIPAIVPGLLAKGLPGTGGRPDQDQQAILKYVSKALQNAANGVAFGGNKEPEMKLLEPFYAAVSSAVQNFVTTVVESGDKFIAIQQLDPTLDPTDPNAVLEAVKASPRLYPRLFAPPDQEYPLGTRPAETRSPLGQLILGQSQKRDRSYDFASISTDRSFTTLVERERKDVLDAVRP